jgi:predicted enzyme related to lactoylglutathione lyase
MDPVVHFQMPALDRDRMAAFYGAAFGWKTEQLGPEMGNYTVVTTTPSGADGRSATPGAINGGFYMRPENNPSLGPSVVIAVEDIERSITAVEAAGGELAGPPEEIPGVGRFASFSDTEGNQVGMLQPTPPGGDAAA